MNQYLQVFDGQIRVMNGESFHITLVENAVPILREDFATYPVCIQRQIEGRARLAPVPEHHCLSH